MLLGIDHLVVAVRDPEAAAAELEAGAGMAWTAGGRHESMGTFNRLAFLGDTYLELIGVFDPARVAANPGFAVGAAAQASLAAGREGFVTFALATDDIAGEVARLRAGGSSIHDPVAGSRARSDGETVRWLTAFPELGAQRPPFLIEHRYEGAEWGSDARAARAAYRHPVGGALRLAGLELPVADRRAAVAAFAAEVGLGFDATGVARLGGQWIRLVLPGRAAMPEDPGWTAAVADRAPVVDIVAEPGAPDLDLERFGVRWRRRPAGQGTSGPSGT
jgi:Glyoxalase-like domain